MTNPIPAEIDVLRLIAAGYPDKQIAEQLSITEESVKGRVKNILSKLGAGDRTQAAMIGVKRGIIQFEALLAKATCFLKRVDREALSGLVAGSRSGTLRKGYL